jgi:hypothetical protein
MLGLPFELGITSCAALLYFAGVSGLYWRISETWARYLLGTSYPWIWWLLAGVYFLCGSKLVIKVFFVAAHHYAGYKETREKSFLRANGDILLAIVMVAEVAVGQGPVKEALSPLGLGHLDWLLLVAGLGIFAGMTMSAVPDNGTEE